MHRNQLAGKDRTPRLAGVLLGLMLAGALGLPALAASIDLTEAGRYDTPGSAADVALAGNYAYVADGGSGLRVISIANPAAPVEKSSYAGNFNSVLYLRGNWDTGAWAAGAGGGYFTVFVIHVTGGPLPMDGVWGQCSISGINVTRIVHSGHYAYLAVYDAGLDIVDIFNDNTPTKVGTYSVTNPTYTKDVAVLGNYAYLAHVTEGMHGINSYGLDVINVSNPASPSYANSFSTNSGTAEGLAISGQYLYIANGTSGLSILSISNPMSPVQVGSFSTAGAANQVMVDGTTAYVSEGGNSVRVLDVSNPAAPVELGYYSAGSVSRIFRNGAYLGTAGGAAGLRMLTFRPPSLKTISPDHALAGQPLTLSCQGLALGDVVSLKLQNQGHTLSAQSVQVNGNSLVASFLAPQPAGLYDLVLSINNVLSQGTCDYALKSMVTLLTPSSGQQAWQVTDLGKAGNPALARPGNIAIADADRDHQAEVYVADNDRTIACYKKGTDWTLTYLQEIQNATYQHLLAADGNQDRDWELFLGSTKTETGQLLMNGSWQGNSLCGYSGSIALGDADHDGANEIYLAGNTETGISLAECNLSGSTWTTRTIEGASYWFDSLAVGDGNHDLADEVYAVNHDHYLYQYRYNGTSWNRSTVATVGNGRTLSMLIADLDHDGQKELYLANQDGNLYRIQWAGSSWSSPAVISSGSVACDQIAVGDADNDGQDEIYGAGQDGHAYQFKVAGSTWQKTDLGLAGTPLTAIAVGDGDNNGQAEVYALGENAHLFQFQAFPSSPTPTPTLAVAPVPDHYLKILNSQINPTRGQKAAIRWSQPADGPATLKIFNLLGERVITLKDHEPYAAGIFNEVVWEGRNAAGSLVGSGIYIVLLQAEGYQAHSKICVIK